MPSPDAPAHARAMRVAAAISISAALVNVIAGLVGLAISRGRRLRALRWYALGSIMAALFCAANAVVGLSLSPLTVVRAARFTMTVLPIYGVAWGLFDFALTERMSNLPERVTMGGSLAFALVAWVPGLIVTDEVVTRTAWFGLVYRDAMPSPLGMAAYAYFSVAMALLAFRCGQRWYRGDRNAAPSCIGLSVLLFAGVLDSLAAAQIIHTPYTLEIASMVVVLVIGIGVGLQFVETSLALEMSANKLASTQAELVERERLAALGEMSAVVAHEVRNPVAVMFNALSGLRRELGANPVGHSAELLAILQEEAETLRRIVGDFLEFAAPLSLRYGSTDVAILLGAALESARAATPSEHAVVIRSEGELGGFHCDVQLVRSAVENLLVNALQTESAPMTIDLVATRSTSHLRVDVLDRGPGVSDAAKERLFTPFFTTRARGTGLGLTIVSRVAKAHGGTLEHRETPGGGATFTLCLPFRTREPGRPREA